MGRASRDKGNRRELQIVARHRAIGVHAEKISGMFTAGHDLNIWIDGPLNLPLRCEVKGRANGAGFKTIEGWLGDNDALFLVRDRQEPLVVLPVSVWERIIGGGNG